MGKNSEIASTIDGQISLFDYYSELFNEEEVLKDDSKELDIDKITISYKRKKKLEITTPSLVAAILTSKYSNHVPLDRQARSFKDNGINIATNTLANWVINSSDTYLSLLYERMNKCIYDSKVLHVGEIPPIVLFDGEPRRTPDYPRDFLSGFLGTIVTDRYQVYHTIVDEYAEIIKSLGDKASKDSIAKQAYDMITKIMHEDNKYDNLTNKDREKNRKLILKPMVNDYFASPHSIHYRS